MNLVIVESPAKAKTIQKYLGKGFIVKSSYGHIRDLPTKELGVDTENNFEPKYVIPPKAKKQVAILKKAAASADTIYFATDEDREGEAIAWHLLETLKPKGKEIKRITFDEITKKAIQNAVANPREIDINRVDAQQARRVLDRLVGYQLSPLLWNKIRRGLSAGRVQSVAVRLIVEREDEINAFKADEYWTLDALLNHQNQEFTARLSQIKQAKLKKLDLKNKQQLDDIISALDQASYEVIDVQSKEKKRTPPPPFTTSTLQQASVNRLGFSGKKTMMIAQQLYEGVELGEDGPTGLITYMRTDSVNLATEATTAAKATIKESFGDEYTLPSPRVFKSKSKGAQEAHEAIRPSNPEFTPDQAAAHLNKDQLRMYTLIWQRMIASQMKEARLNTVTALIQAGDDHTFKATGTTITFDGFMQATGQDKTVKESLLPELKVKDQPKLKELQPEQHFTQPPARYSEATLVKALEENGIGRPSTYAPTIDTVQQRQYVEKNEDKKFAPTEIGTIVTKLLIEHFPNIVDLEFTAKMEEDLDAIATGHKKWQPVIDDFYQPFHKNLLKKDKEIDKKALTEQPTDEKCPKCTNDMVIKLGRFGRFKACSNYPECKHTEPIGEEKKLQEESSGEKCPDCSKDLVLKHGRFGPFLGCSGYPECKHIKKINKGTGVNCPLCEKGEIVEKKSRRGKLFFACNQYPDCENAYWSKPTGEKCPDCTSLLVFGAKNTVRCSSKECKFSKAADIE